MKDTNTALGTEWQDFRKEIFTPQELRESERKAACLKNYVRELEKNAVPDEKIDLSDAPELTEEDFKRGHFKALRGSLAKYADTELMDKENGAWERAVKEKYGAHRT